MKLRFIRCLSASLVLTIAATGCPLLINFNPPPVGSRTKNTVWPISGTTTPDAPLSSAFGPRLKFSENDRYDFHRGIDIPVAFGSPVYAIANGTVRISGMDDGYSDLLVQLKHTDGDTEFYSNYIHLSSAIAIAGSTVNKGDLIGLSGVGDSGFPHLHFEIRENGLFQRHAINPFVRLNYPDANTPQVTIDQVNTETPGNPIVTCTVRLPRDEADDELDFNEIVVSVYLISGDSMDLVDEHSYNMQSWNLAYTPQPPDDPNQFLDDPEFNGITVAPASFVSSSNEYVVQFTFNDLIGPQNPDDMMITATARDIDDNSDQDVWPAE